MNDIKSNIHNGFIEICEMNPDDVAGRVKIKMTSHLIHEDKTEWNRNGITWLEEYSQNNIKSAIGMNYVVDFIDEEKTIPSGHGEMYYDDDGNVQFKGEVVGSVVDAYITDIMIDGEEKRVFMTEGYINSQRYGNFVKWLREEIKNNTVHGSIEINGKGKSRQIEYLDGSTDEDGNLKVGRIPTVFDFSALAILYIEEPADQYSQVIELNSKNRKVDMSNKVEVNELNQDEILELVMRKFYEKYCSDSECYSYDLYVYRLYPESRRVIIRDYKNVGKYLMFDYKINNSDVDIGEIITVEEDWKPVSDEKSIEINNYVLIKNSNNEGGKVMEKLIREKDAQIQELNSKIAELDTEVNELKASNEEKEGKVQELNSTLVEVNKTLKAMEEEKEGMTSELNSLREFKESEVAKQKEAEVNSYFETEIKANGFTEAEVNSLKEYVEKVDLEGLKSAEAELCVKKLKEMNKQDKEVETNSVGSEFFVATKPIKEEEVKMAELEEGAKLFQ